MMLNELIERLCDLSREYGQQEVKLLTQKDKYSWRDYNIGEVIYNVDDRAVVIVGKGKTKATWAEDK